MKINGNVSISVITQCVRLFQFHKAISLTEKEILLKIVEGCNLTRKSFTENKRGVHYFC